MKEPFDIQYWLNYNVTSCDSQPQTFKTKNLSASTRPDSVSSFSNDTETVVSRIEATHTDITANYTDWVKLGIALSNEHGEGGRGYFHRISKFYHGYSQSDCDKQYNKCLDAKGKRANIGSFFHMAQEAGIDIYCGNNDRSMTAHRPVVSVQASTELAQEIEAIAEPSIEGTQEIETIAETPESVRPSTPLLPTEVYQNLPLILRESCALFHEGIEQDVLLVSAIGVISACLPNVEGIYFNNPLTPHIYLFNTAPAAAGKGIMKWARWFGQNIHDHLIGQSRNAQAAYEVELEMYENLSKAQKLSGQRPTEPSRKMLFIPANSSSSAFIQAMAENNNCGIIFETEADSMAKTSRQDWGDSSDLYRNAFEHETISMYRRKEREYLEIKSPHLAIVMSGTPKQVNHIMPDVENGLFSRFMYYKFEDHGGFKNPFVSPSNLNYMEFFSEKGKYIFDLWQELQKRTLPLTFKLTKEQENRFTDSFDQMLTKDRLLVGTDFDANVKRMGINHFRIAMILTVLRMFEDGERTDILTCSDQDYETAMTIVTTLEKHAIAVYHNLDNNVLKGNKLAFFEKLPLKFDRQGYLKVAAELGINPKTAEYYIGQFQPKLIMHDDHNDYTKITN